MNKNRSTEEILESIYMLVNEAQNKQITYSEESSKSKFVKKKHDKVDIIDPTKETLDWKKIDFSKYIKKNTKNTNHTKIEKIFYEEFSKWLKNKRGWIKLKIKKSSEEFIEDKFKNI